jgi:hypothetical protein
VWFAIAFQPALQEGCNGLDDGAAKSFRPNSLSLSHTNPTNPANHDGPDIFREM